MMDCLKPKPEPKRRVPACEDADAISSRIAEIARSEGREPHRLNPAEMKPAPAETGDLYGIGLRYLAWRAEIERAHRAETIQTSAAEVATEVVMRRRRGAHADPQLAAIMRSAVCKPIEGGKFVGMDWRARAICGEHEDGA